MNDLTWCCSPDCPVKCEQHITNYPIKDVSELVSIADFSGVCREYIGRVLAQVEDGDSDV